MEQPGLAVPTTATELKEALGAALLRTGFAEFSQELPGDAAQLVSLPANVQAATAWLTNFPNEVTELSAMAAAALQVSPNDSEGAMVAFMRSFFGSALIQEWLTMCPEDYLRQTFLLALRDRNFLRYLAAIRDLSE